MLRRPWLTGLLILFCLACIPAGWAVINAAGIGVKSRTVQDQAEFLAPYAALHLPVGARSPVPAVIFMHGCGGVRPLHERYARKALDAGYAVLILDSLGPRGMDRSAGLTRVCTGLDLWGGERAADVFGALAMLRGDPRIDARRIALAGWSHGGWSALEAIARARSGSAIPGLDAASTAHLTGLRAVILFYPYCSLPMRVDPAHLVGTAPIRAVLSEHDLIAAPGACRELFDQARSAGAVIEYEIWDAQTHAFDEAGANGFDPRVRYDRAATRRAEDLLASILRETV